MKGDTEEDSEEEGLKAETNPEAVDADLEETANEGYQLNSYHMKKLIAVPSSNGLLDAHFGHCRQFALLSVEDDKIISESIIDAPPHEPGLLPKFLAEKGVTDVIAGGMGNRAIELFNQHHVNVFVGAPKQAPKEIANGFLTGSLEFSANYCDH